MTISGLLIQYSQATALNLIMEGTLTLVPEARKHDHRYSLVCQKSAFLRGGNALPKPCFTPLNYK